MIPELLQLGVGMVELRTMTLRQATTLVQMHFELRELQGSGCLLLGSK